MSRKCRKKRGERKCHGWMDKVLHTDKNPTMGRKTLCHTDLSQNILLYLHPPSSPLHDYPFLSSLRVVAFKIMSESNNFYILFDNCFRTGLFFHV